MIAIWKLYGDRQVVRYVNKFKVCFLLPIDFPYDSSMETLWELKFFNFFSFYMCTVHYQMTN